MLLLDMVKYVSDQGLGVLPPTAHANTYYGTMPELDADDGSVTIVLYEYGGLPMEPNLGTNTPRLEFPFMQAVTRGVANDYDSPKLKMQQLVTAFTKIINTVLLPSGQKYLIVAAKQPPFRFRIDDNRRHLFAVNFGIMKEYSAS